MFRFLFGSILLAALVGGTYYLFTTEGRQLVDRITINCDRKEDRGHFRAARPTPGTPDLTRFAARMEEAGIHVTYGVVGLKTHSKVILVVRKDYNKLRRYAHIGTGNYHADTARLYSDLGILTNDQDLGRDATELFNYLTTGYTPERYYRKLLPAPKVLKVALLARIQRERSLHSADKPGLIQFKMNALEDKDITQALDAYARAPEDAEEIHFADGNSSDNVQMRFAAEIVWFF